MNMYSDVKPQSCSEKAALYIKDFYKGWSCSSLVHPNFFLFKESYSSVATTQYQ